jgi:hypothetical protein
MSKLRPWHIGFIPETIIKPDRVTPAMIKMAEIGYEVGRVYFNADLYFTQSLILGSCLNPNLLYLLFITTSRYGKSWTLSKAALTLAGLYKKEVSIGGADEEKAKIIMGKITKSLGTSHEILKAGLEGRDKFEKAATAISKSSLGWAHGGSINTFGLSERLKNSDVEGGAAIGLGGDIILLDESALISDDNYSVAARMIVEKPDTKLIEISNPHRKGHFFDSYNDPETFTVHIDFRTAIEEGRLDERKLAKAKEKMTTRNYKIFYLCQFPEENEFSYFKPKTYTVLPKIVEYYAAVDFSMGKKRENFNADPKKSKGCLTGIVVLGLGVDGQIYEVDSVGEPLTPDEALDWIFNSPYKFKRVGLETVLFQELIFEQAKKRSQSSGKYIPFVGINNRRKKMGDDGRIEGLEPQINTGQILFKGNNELYTELGAYGVYKYFVDVLDALEMCFGLIKNRTKKKRDEPNAMREVGAPLRHRSKASIDSLFPFEKTTRVCRKVRTSVR